MLDVFATDVMYLSSDLLTGKSLPLLLSVATMPIDLALLGTVLALGVACGTLHTLWDAQRAADRIGWRACARSLLQHLFHAWLSLAVWLLLAGRVPDGAQLRQAVTLLLVPCYALVTKTLPPGGSTVTVAFLLNAAVLLFCFLEDPLAHAPHLVPPSQASQDPLALESVPHRGGPVLRFQVQQGPRSRHLLAAQRAENVQDVREDLLALHRAPIHHHAAIHAPDPLQTVWRALFLFVLALHASTQHGPLGHHYAVVGGAAGSRKYASVHLAINARYASAVGATAFLVRLLAYLLFVHAHHSATHRLVDGLVQQRGPLRDGGVHSVCAWVYQAALLYSATWSCTLASSQGLDPLLVHPHGTRLLCTVLLLVAAAAYRTCQPLEAMQWLAVASVLATSVLSLGG
jgi:hypothetical protein